MKDNNYSNITRLIYESYMHPLNEDEESQTKKLIDFNPTLEKGELVIYINIEDQNLFGALRNVANELLDDIDTSRQRKGLPQMTDSERMEKGKQFATGQVRNEDSMQVENEYLRFIVCKTTQLSDIFDENGQLINGTEYKRVVAKILTIINKLKKYGFHVDNEDVNNMLHTIFFYATQLPTKEDMDNIKRDTDDLFFKICNTLGEEETQKLLRTIDIADTNIIADHMFNFNNKLRIIAQAQRYDANGDNQLNTITYLATQRQWLKMGRRVIDFSHPYNLLAFHGGDGNAKKEDEILANRGQSVFKGVRGRRTRNIETNAEAYGRNGFGYHLYFDVSATQTVSGIEDKFTEEPGMINNMTGELNQLAYEKISQQNNDNSKQQSRTDQLNKLFNTTDYSKINLTYMSICKAFNHKPTITNDDSVENMIAASAKILESQLKKSLQDKTGGGIVKADNYTPLLKIGRLMIQSIIGLPMDNTERITLSDDYKQIAQSLQPIISDMVKEIFDAKKQLLQQEKANMSLNEVIDIYSPLFILDETFNKILNKIIENVTY